MPSLDPLGTRDGSVSASGTARLATLGTERLGQAPIDDQGLAIFAQHHVARFQITM